MKRTAVLGSIAFLALFYFSVSASATPTDGVSKGTISAGVAVVGAVGSFFSFGALDVAAAIHVFAIQVSNDIKVSQHATDPNFSSPVTPAPLALARTQTDVTGSSEAVNVALNAAVNAELQHASTLMAAATATNRFFTALDNGDNANAAARLSQLQNLVASIDQLGHATAMSFQELATALKLSGNDPLINGNAFDAFQVSLASNGFPPAESALFAALVPNVDPGLLNSPPNFIEPVSVGLQKLSEIRSVDIATEAPHFSDAVVQGAGAIDQISQVVGPFPVSEPSTITLILGGSASLWMLNRRRWRRNVRRKAESNRVCSIKTI
jgi:hypothetical protein